MFISFWELLFPSVAMGIMIAIDVSIATVGKIRDWHISTWNWTLPVTVAHVVLLLIGYLVFWKLALEYPWLRPTLGVIGFILVGFLVFAIIKEILCAPEPCGITETIEKQARDKTRRVRHAVHILAVSWDALLTGPIFAIKATAQVWSTQEVIVALCIVGIMVALIAEVALFATIKLRNIRYNDVTKLARFNLVARFTELSVIGGFGLHSLLQGLFSTGDLLHGIAGSAIIMLFIFWILRTQLWQHALADAHKTIRGT